MSKYHMADNVTTAEANMERMAVVRWEERRCDVVGREYREVIAEDVVEDCGDRATMVIEPLRIAVSTRWRS